ncbi:hypothetical protein GCM10007377_11080 [Galliscardovia ingluviei]|uniref:Uncharacterized protein n=1 Tax=Galliscardovia ingluviei TaxID=1769422 RepID=A0A8J3EYP6_9BIFI|nr:hypothetical protein GCM10007377_11080 [Galliscardovia ingluviei]
MRGELSLQVLEQAIGQTAIEILVVRFSATKVLPMAGVAYLRFCEWCLQPEFVPFETFALCVGLYLIGSFTYNDCDVSEEAY